MVVVRFPLSTTDVRVACDGRQSPNGQRGESLDVLEVHLRNNGCTRYEYPKYRPEQPTPAKELRT
jgi:hypothetical protein